MKSALIIDDHPLFCEALATTLETLCGVATVARADCLEAALARLGAGPMPSIVLLDLNLPDVSGIDGLVRVVKAAPGVPVLVVSSQADRRVVMLTLGAGAAGFVPKHSHGSVFRTALEIIARGERFLPEAMDLPAEEAPLDDRTAVEEAVDRLGLLTLQQAKILRLVCSGMLNKQIAHELGIAETTVKAHMTAILRKLKVHSRTQAVLVAQRAHFDRLPA